MLYCITKSKKYCEYEVITLRTRKQKQEEKNTVIYVSTERNQIASVKWQNITSKKKKNLKNVI